MQGKIFVVGDIHGGLKALEQVLAKAAVNANDTLIFLGDYVDGWSESLQVLEFLMAYQQTQKCIFVKGNHDDLLLNYLKKGTYSEEWLIHGGISTLEAYKNADGTLKQKHIDFLESLLDYYLDSNNRLFLHAGFTNLKGVNYEYFKKIFYWDRTLWETAVGLNPEISIDDLRYPPRLNLYPEIYIGHTPTTRLGSPIPLQKACIWNVDTGAAFQGSLTIMDCETKAFWQSDPLPDLYPLEKGRN
jgi:serine/threonine protein phosphatase 1